MNLLAIDSSTEACSVALLQGVEMISRYELAPRRHAELILPFVDELMAQAGLQLTQIDALAFGRGPGAFTGLRIATGVVQGIAFASDLPVIPISSLAALAQGARRERGHDRVIAAIDARMEEIYWGAFESDGQGLMLARAEEAVLPAASVPAVDGANWHGCGSGWSSYGNVLSEQYQGQLTDVDGERLPQAVDIALLAVREYQQGRMIQAEQALPVYLRDKVAEKSR